MKEPKTILEERSIVAESIRGMADLANDAEHDWSGVDEEKWIKINANFGFGI